MCEIIRNQASLIFCSMSSTLRKIWTAHPNSIDTNQPARSLLADLSSYILQIASIMPPFNINCRKRIPFDHVICKGYSPCHCNSVAPSVCEKKPLKTLKEFSNMISSPFLTSFSIYHRKFVKNFGSF